MTPPRRPRTTPVERRQQRAAVDDPAVVLEAAARFLEVRPRSIHEVRRRLTGVGYRPDLVEGAITRLEELAMLDDEVFARAWVESRDRAHPRGERAIRDELRRKGVDEAVVRAVLDERREAADAVGDDAVVSPDRVAADRLLARHARALGRVADPRARRQRAYALLARHGFDPEVCREAAVAFLGSGDPSDGGGADPPGDGP